MEKRRTQASIKDEPRLNQARAKSSHPSVWAQRLPMCCSPLGSDLLGELARFARSPPCFLAEHAPVRCSLPDSDLQGELARIAR